MHWGIMMPENFYTGVDYTAVFQVNSVADPQADSDEEEEEEAEAEEEEEAVIGDYYTTFTFTLRCSDCGVAPAAGWSDLSDMESDPDISEQEETLVIRPALEEEEEEEDAPDFVCANGSDSECEFVDAQFGASYFVSVLDIGLSTIGACQLSGDAITDEDISVVGVIDPYIANGVMNCGALFEIDSDASSDTELELILTANGVAHEFWVTVEAESDSTEETEEQQNTLNTVLLLMLSAATAAIAFFSF